MMNPAGIGGDLGGPRGGGGGGRDRPFDRKIPLFLSSLPGSFLPSFLFLINGAAVFAAETAICPPPPIPPLPSRRCDLEPIRLAYSKVSSRSMIYGTAAAAPRDRRLRY